MISCHICPSKYQHH